jgi:hypothetical protein
MSRTVVTFIGRGADKTFFLLDDTPGDIASAGESSEVNLADLPEGTLVQRGKSLLALLQGDVGVKEGLAALLANAEGSDPAPLYFRVRATSADAVAWEQLYADQQGFVALDRRWPIGRIAKNLRRLESRTFAPPLRVLAILSAAGRDGASQLQALAAARDATELPVSLSVVSGDEELASEANALGIAFQQIASSGPGLMRQITAANPQVLHVLCHGGGFAAGLWRLAFANATDFDAAQLDPRVVGSMLVPVRDLVEALRPCNPWLVVLAACETASPDGTAGDGTTNDGLALAHDLASNGIPAVIGMRRLVDIAATDAFCRELYPEAFEVVRQSLTPSRPGASPIRTIDWAEALTAPRRAMSNPDPETVDSWTDPVLYAQYEPLEIFLPPPQVSPEARAEIIGRIDQLKGGLAVALAGGAQPAALNELQQIIADLEAQLRG